MDFFRVLDQKEKILESAIDLVRKDNETTFRYAMMLLGRFRAPEGVDVLIEKIDRRYTNCELLEENFPAVKALIQIGKPAAKKLIETLRTEYDENRMRLMGFALAGIEGKERAIELVRDLERSEQDEGAKERMTDLIRYLDEE